MSQTALNFAAVESVTVIDGIEFLLVEDLTREDSERFFNSELERRFELTIEQFRRKGKTTQFGYIFKKMILEHNFKEWRLSKYKR